MVNAANRKNTIKLIDEARESGARLEHACEIIGISARTHQRWVEGGFIKEDQGPIIERPPPPNKLSEEERKKVIETVNTTKFADLPPCKLVPLLADQGNY